MDRTNCKRENYLMFNFHRTLLGTIVFIVASLATPVHAQDVLSKPTTKYCWRGQPQPACDIFLITEYTAYYGVNQPTATIRYTPYGSDPYDMYQVRREAFTLTGEVGGMKNISTRSAVGATALLGIFGEGVTIGAKFRYRQWLSPQGIALDLSAGARTSRDRYGVAFYPTERYREPQLRPAFTSDVAINVRDYAAFVTRFEVERFGGRYQPLVSVGIRAASKPAAFGAAGTLTTFGLLFGLYALAYHGN